MDVITIIWYFSTFLMLVLFFVVMVCSDNICNNRGVKPEEPPPEAPPSPAPSYREFAPPGYDTVMKKYKSRRISVSNAFFAYMEPPPPTSPISTVSERIDFPATFRVSVHEVPESIESGQVLELRVINSVAFAEQNATRTSETSTVHMDVICEEESSEEEAAPVQTVAVVIVNEKHEGELSKRPTDSRSLSERST